MATLADVAEIVAWLPEVETDESDDELSWRVSGRAFAWERPFSKADLKRFGEETPPDGPILAVRVSDLAEKEAILAAAPNGIFTIPHFNGYAAVLIQLKLVSKRDLRRALTEAWLAKASPSLAAEFLSPLS